MIALDYSNTLLEGNLVYAGGRMVDEGADLETAALISLACDARAAPGDLLPEGTNRRGWWADTFDDGSGLGAMLWLLEDAVATPANARRAELYAQDALKWMIDDGAVRAITTEAEAQRDAVWLKIVFTLPNGQQQTLSPFKAF